MKTFTRVVTFVLTLILVISCDQAEGDLGNAVDEITEDEAGVAQASESDETDEAAEAILASAQLVFDDEVGDDGGDEPQALDNADVATIEEGGNATPLPAAIDEGATSRSEIAAPSEDAEDEGFQSRPGRPEIFAQARKACEADGGRFGPAADKQAFVCYRTLKDANRRCDSADDCLGLCLARSRTCSPIEPFFGCHEVLLKGGQRATQCVE